MDPDDLISKYIEMGVINIEGLDDNGEFMLSITEKAEELAPELFEQHQKHVESIILDWFEKGWVNITYDEDLTAYIEITEAGEEIAKKFGM
jgi:hypothetical protein